MVGCGTGFAGAGGSSDGSLRSGVEDADVTGSVFDGVVVVGVSVSSSAPGADEPIGAPVAAETIAERRQLLSIREGPPCAVGLALPTYAARTYLPRQCVRSSLSFAGREKRGSWRAD